MLRGEGFEPGPLEPDEAMRCLGAWVGRCMAELDQLISALDATSIVDFALRHERLLAVNCTRLIPELSDIALPVGVAQAPLDGTASVALRACVELAAARSGNGSLAMADEVFHRAWWLADEAVNYGGLRDAVRGGLAAVTIHDEGGRRIIAPDDAFSAALRDHRERTLIEDDADGVPPDEVILELDAAVEHEIGAPLTTLIWLLSVLRDRAQERRGCQIADRDALLAQSGADRATREEFDAALTFLSLSPLPAGAFASGQYFWRFRREYSHLIRPLLQIPGEPPRIAWGPLTSDMAMTAVASAFMTKAHRPKTRKLRTAIERATAWRSLELERRKAAHFESDPRLHVERGVNKPLGEIAHSHPGRLLGDLDVLVLDPVCRLIVVIEVKGRTPALVPENIANERKDWAEIQRKLDLRLAWLEDHKSDLLGFRGIEPDRVELWRVLGHIVVRGPMASVALSNLRAPVTSFHSLLASNRDEWLASGCAANGD